MSYLEMKSSELPDMKSGVISVWFRDPTLNPAPPEDDWPLPMPPNTLEYINDHPEELLFWNAYGLPIPFFGTTFLYPAQVTLPYPPPLQTNNMHMLLAFGDPNQKYDYCQWKQEYPDVIPYVQYAGSPVPGIGFRPEDWPAPYAPYMLAEGKKKFANFRIDAPSPRADIVPQSFIAVDKDGYIRICLQTKTKADYKGYCFQIDEIINIMATLATTGESAPGHIPPLEHWPGYWDGYQFMHKDISNEVMAAAGECFMIGSGGFNINDAGQGPRVTGPGWHHLLFSFDLDGEVIEKQMETSPTYHIPVITEFSSHCKAWLAVDDFNYTGTALQKAYPIHQGPLGLPLLPGQGANFGSSGTTHVFARRFFPGIGPNDIVPQNAWLYGSTGTPRSGIVNTYYSSAGISNGLAPYGPPAGDYQSLNWTGGLATAYYGAGAPVPLDPPRPAVPDPMAFYDAPSYQGGPYVLPTHGFPIGIPAQKRHLKHNTGLEMAELQIWANKTLDTADIDMRRLFIDYPKNAAGLPDKTKPLEPVPPSVAAEVLGEPDILLHGTSNWKSGINTGKTGYTTDAGGRKIPNTAGQFVPVARIEKYLPDPKLGR